MNTEYILYARLSGAVAEDLNLFWQRCNEKESLRNEAVTVYPPHITLTGFFPKAMRKSEYVAAISEILQTNAAAKNTELGERRLVRKPHLHAVYFKNDFLRLISELFAEKIGLPKERLKATVEMPEFHLTLAHNFNPDVEGELVEREGEIDFEKPHQMSVCLFKSERVDGKRLLTLKHETIL